MHRAMSPDKISLSMAALRLGSLTKRRGEMPQSASSSLSIVSLMESPDMFDLVLKDPAFAAIEAHPQTGAYARSYYPAVHEKDHRDLSFSVCMGGVPILVVLCTLIGGTIGLHGLPLKMFARDDLLPENYCAAVKAA